MDPDVRWEYCSQVPECSMTYAPGFERSQILILGEAFLWTISAGEGVMASPQLLGGTFPPMVCSTSLYVQLNSLMVQRDVAKDCGFPRNIK